MIAALGVDADVLSQMLRGTSASLSFLKNAYTVFAAVRRHAFLPFPDSDWIQIVSRSY